MHRALDSCHNRRSLARRGGCVQGCTCTDPSPRGERCLRRARGLLRAENDVFPRIHAFSARRATLSPCTQASPRENAKTARVSVVLRAENDVCTRKLLRSARRTVVCARKLSRSARRTMFSGNGIALRAETVVFAPQVSRSARRRMLSREKGRSPRKRGTGDWAPAFAGVTIGARCLFQHSWPVDEFKTTSGPFIASSFSPRRPCTSPRPGRRSRCRAAFLFARRCRCPARSAGSTSGGACPELMFE